MNVLGIIPARQGSKRVKNKNIRLLDGKPLIQYTIEAAAKSKLLSRFIVTTDSTEIRDIVLEAGADAPFLRPEKLADDVTPDRPVLTHAMQWLEEHQGFKADIVVLLRPTTPFKTPEIIDGVIQMLIDHPEADSVRTMTEAESVHHPFWMYKIGENNKAEQLLPEYPIDQYNQSWQLPPIYRLNGVVDAMRASVILDPNKTLYGDDMRVHKVSDVNSLDIDTELDFKICEVFMKERKATNAPQ